MNPAELPEREPAPTGDRDWGARDRDTTAETHDTTSLARDGRAAARDARANDRQQVGAFDPDAAADRAAAKRDRASSATDRQRAADDRRAAAEDRARAAAERSSLVLDGLTGTHLRKPGLMELQREVMRAKRTKLSFVLAFVDVDGLKEMNDDHGHRAGDELLRQVVGSIRSGVRDYDLIVRYGGDEFLCGFLDLDLDGAAERFAEIRTNSTNGLRGSFSVGIAELSADDDLDGLIARADRAMYESRRRLRGS
jgi:diguanylate cyclase (GGDEF)-like protein